MLSFVKLCCEFVMKIALRFHVVSVLFEFAVGIHVVSSCCGFALRVWFVLVF